MIISLPTQPYFLVILVYDVYSLFSKAFLAGGTQNLLHSPGGYLGGYVGSAFSPVVSALTLRGGRTSVRQSIGTWLEA